MSWKMEIPPQALENYELECQMLCDFFPDNSSGTFVEIGSNHPVILNLTYPLEKLGWSGLLVEPIPELAQFLMSERKNTIVSQTACTSPSKVGAANFHITDSGGGNVDDLQSFGTSSCLEKNIEDYGVQYGRTIQVECVTLKELLIRHNIGKFDLLIVDTEGTELDVLLGADLPRQRPQLILVEDRFYSLQKHLFLRRSGYRLLRHFNWSSWYIPEESTLQSEPLLNRLKVFRKMFLGLPFRKLKRWLEHGKSNRTG